MATANILLYKSKTYKDGTHPVLLDISHRGQRKRFVMGFSCLEHDWDKEHQRLHPKAKEARKRNRILRKNLLRAEEIIDKFAEQGRPFSMKEFEMQFSGGQSRTVYPYFEKVIAELKQKGMIGNAYVYEDTFRAFKKYHPDAGLTFCEIDCAFLMSVEQGLLSTGVRPNSISVYMRTLRALFNRAIKEKVCPRDCYPFLEYKVGRLKTSASKTALTQEEIDKIKHFNPAPNTKQGLSQHLFIFSFYNRGMTFSDIAKLQWSDVRDGLINYRRSESGKLYTINIVEPVAEILDYYRQLNIGNPYVFPILDLTYNAPAAIKNRIKSGLKRANKHLKEMAIATGIEKKITFGLAYDKMLGRLASSTQAFGSHS